jgi:hypothetical protein
MLVTSVFTSLHPTTPWADISPMVKGLVRQCVTPDVLGWMLEYTVTASCGECPCSDYDRESATVTVTELLGRIMALFTASFCEDLRRRGRGVHVEYYAVITDDASFQHSYAPAGCPVAQLPGTFAFQMGTSLDRKPRV